MAHLLQHVAESGFPLMDRMIHVFVGGSERTVPRCGNR
jgi:hypothetical protein